jgi:hypothetical protein
MNQLFHDVARVASAMRSTIDEAAGPASRGGPTQGAGSPARDPQRLYQLVDTHCTDEELAHRFEVIKFSESDVSGLEKIPEKRKSLGSWKVLA